MNPGGVEIFDGDVKVNNELKSKEQIQEEINCFFNYFNEKLEFVKEHCLFEEQQISGIRIEGVIICACCIDALGFYKYGGRSKRERFTKVIRHYSELATEYQKVSVARLKRELQQRQNSLNHKSVQVDYKPLIEFLEQDLNVRSENYLNLSYNPDMSYQELEKKIKCKFGIDYFLKLKDEIKKYRYLDILWRDYRCMPVHALRIKHKALNIAQKTEPYYCNLSKLQEGKLSQETRFGIPPEFILRTIENCLNNCKKECIRNNISPFDLKGAKED